MRQDSFEEGAAEHYYHGTARALRSVKPATQHGRGTTFPSDTEPDYAYASKNESDAWTYAEKAWHASGEGVPRVYRVAPKGEVETDPSHTPAGVSRGNFRGDVRSRQGFSVLNSVQMPESMGKPSEWR